jgi:hypothetical protein
LLDRRGFLKVTMATLGAMLVVPLTALAQTKPLPETKPNEIMPENPSTYIPPQGAEGPSVPSSWSGGHWFEAPPPKPKSLWRHWFRGHRR